jgi:type IV secretion system protein TrbL
MDPGILTRLLNDFLFVFTGGMARLTPDAFWLLERLVVLEIVFMALWWALTGEEALVTFLQRALWIGFFIWLTTNFADLLTIVLQSFVQAGLTAGGARITVREFLDPSAIAAYGLHVTTPLFHALSQLTGWSAVFGLPHVMVTGLAALLLVMAFFLLAIQVFLTLLEFYIAAVVSLLLIPFGVNARTAFIAERVFGMVLSFGVKLMVLAFITSAALPTLATITFTNDPTFNELFSALLASFAIAMLAWHAPNVAAGLMSGQPSLTVGTAVGTAFAASATAVYSTRATGQSLATVYGGTKGLAATGAALSTAAHQGYTTTTGGRLTRVAGGTVGMGRLAGGTLLDLGVRVTSGYRTALQQGRLYAEQVTTKTPPPPTRRP